MARIYENLADTFGNTPLVKLNRLGKGLPGTVLVKMESFNPGGSVKDRAALSMILEGERSGKLRPGMTILDATSGNTGIAYAWIGAALGYPVTLCLPANASMERKSILKAYGAELILTDPAESTDGSQRKAKQLAAQNPDLYFYPDQYNNEANWRAHYEHSGPEIWRQNASQRNPPIWRASSYLG